MSSHFVCFDTRNNQRAKATAICVGGNGFEWTHDFPLIIIRWGEGGGWVKGEVK